MDGSEAYVNGVWLPRAQSQVSIFDRGFLFGDGVYELIPVYDYRPFLLPRHVQRLLNSLAEVKIASPHDQAGWEDLIPVAAERQTFADQKIYVQVTRGGSDPRQPKPQPGIKPTVVMFVDPLPPVDEDTVQRGLRALTCVDFRWQRGDIKAISLLGAVLLAVQADAAGVDEMILLRDGMVTEGSSSNVIIAQNGVLTVATPPAGTMVLAGVTLDYICQLSAKEGIPITRRAISDAELRGANEIMISSSSRELVAVSSLDGETIGTGVAGPQARRLRQLYLDSIGDNLGCSISSAD